ncbi:MAG: rod shape-determining protein RodA [Spirochaetes bacterium GWF1_51_8]|nr:MAG: rod shape-determining protein RodA [Spirochaetes bacterium GWF1_51_8]
MLKENLKNINLGLIIIPLVLSVIGLIFIYSSGIIPDGSNTGQYIKQIIWMVAGIGLAILILSMDYSQLVEVAEILFLIGIVVLLATLVIGKTIRGAKSWFGVGGLGIQPSEIMKIFFILLLAKFFSNASPVENKFRTFVISIVMLALPLGLILLQPDLGTSLVFLGIYIVMSFLGMPDDRYIKYIMLTGLVTSILVLGNAYYKFYFLEMFQSKIELFEIIFNFNTMLIVAISMFLYTIVAVVLEFFNPVEIIRKILPFTVIAGISFGVGAVSTVLLKPYQWKRLLVFLNPEFDRWGAGYNIIQSKIAIGSGGFAGKGIFRGTQNILGFLPEKSTDFIFSIISEESGFLGGTIVIALFCIYFLYILRTVSNANDKEGMLISAGILGMFFIHFLVNIGMTLGTAPVTGLPLPFVSYGGSSYLTFIIAAALLANIHSRRFVH